jgi:hypothetical protein
MFWVFIEFEKLSRDPKARAMLHVVFIEFEKLSRNPCLQSRWSLLLRSLSARVPASRPRTDQVRLGCMQQPNRAIATVPKGPSAGTRFKSKACIIL